MSSIQRAQRSPFGACCTAVACLIAVACSRTPEAGRPVPVGEQVVSRPLEIYRDLGMKAGPPQFPVVVSYATMAGPGDSTFMFVSLSMPSSALRFERGGDGFTAEYSVSLAFMQDSAVVQRLDDRQRVVVGTFAETGRIDESVLYQNAIALAPGRYVIELKTADAHSSRGFAATDTVEVPAYGPQSTRLGTPVVVYSADGRPSRDVRPTLVSNPRHTVSYGVESPKLYVETYGAPAGEPVRVNVVDEKGASIWSANAVLPRGNDSLRSGMLDLPGDQLPLGRMWVEVTADGATSARTPLLLTISDQWMIANIGEVIEFLRYVAFQDELDSLSVGTPAEQRAAWDSFWAKRDPISTTATNEFRDQFFERVRYATDNFREPGLMGWNTDRGEVYIVLGPPDVMGERYVGNVDENGLPNAQEWVYERVPGGRMNLLFVDRGGFGRLELAPSSESAFRATADRLKPKRR